MKVIAISSQENTEQLVSTAAQCGYITFVYHHADPQHELLSDKFLYVGSDEELVEKLHLLQMDVSAQDAIRIKGKR